MVQSSVSLAEIERAQSAIQGRVRNTPVLLSQSLSRQCGCEVILKLEHWQETGSFKLRGATNAIRNLSDDAAKRGVVGVSTGNHGRGLAHAARKTGIGCTIFMSSLVPKTKLDAIDALGAEIRITGHSQDDAQDEADRFVVETGKTMLPPFDHPHVIAGQGTLGLELVEQVSDLDTVLVPLSGGGLISGVAAAIKAKKPSVRVIGISMERGAAMHASLAAGKPMPVEELPTLADSLGGGVGEQNQYTFAMVRDLVDEIVLLTEAEIAAGIRHAYWEERQILEGGGAVGIAAILSGKYRPSGKTVIVLSGGNIDMKLHHRIVGGEDVDPAREVS